MNNRQKLFGGFCLHTFLQYAFKICPDLSCAPCTVKLGYNELGYNKLSLIANKY